MMLTSMLTWAGSFMVGQVRGQVQFFVDNYLIPKYDVFGVLENDQKYDEKTLNIILTEVNA